MFSMGSCPAQPIFSLNRVHELPNYFSQYMLVVTNKYYDKLKFAGKDKVFRDIFSIKKYLYQMYQALHGRTPEAAEEIIRICCDRNLLKEYLTERKKEIALL